MSNYAKGKWKLKSRNIKVRPYTIYNVINGLEYDIADIIVYIPDYPEGTKANANLIVLAPDMYDLLKSFSFIPDCGGDFCFLATEGMENECPEPEEGITGDCKHKGYCRWANSFMIKRDKVLAKAEVRT